MKKICYNIPCSAGVAHPVERHLAKVEVASSSLVTRSRNPECKSIQDFFCAKYKRPLSSDKGLLYLAFSVISGGDSVGVFEYAAKGFYIRETNLHSDVFHRKGSI